MEDDCQDMVVCDKCECEFHADESMPHPKDGRGDYCFECLTEVTHEYDVERGTAYIKRFLPTLEDFMVGYQKHAKGHSLDYMILVGNCHAAANTLVQMTKNKLDIKLQRGHWLGNDAREERAGFPMQQHSWTLVKVEGNPVQFIVDPTQWVFTGRQPGIAIVDEDDRRYDMGGYNMKAAILGAPKIAAREGKLVPSKLSKKAQAELNRLAPRDWTQWTPGEMITIANLDPRNLPLAKEIFTAIIKCGNKGFIPLEGKDYLGL
jgi:hypothetical protein